MFLRWFIHVLIICVLTQSFEQLASSGALSREDNESDAAITRFLQLLKGSTESAKEATTTDANGAPPPPPPLPAVAAAGVTPASTTGLPGPLAS